MELNPRMLYRIDTFLILFGKYIIMFIVAHASYISNPDDVPPRDSSRSRKQTERRMP